MVRGLLRRLPVSSTQKKYLKFAYFRLMAALGIRTSPSLFGLGDKIDRHLGQRRGFFIEVGANDGISQSNTWHLEKYDGWSGLLVEAVPRLERLCRRFRNARVVHCALGSFAAAGQTLEISDNDLMTSVKASGDRAEKTFAVQVRPLSAILDEMGSPKIDFFSLDVEGFELDVLSGLDLTRHRPEFILVETSQFEAVERALQPFYSFVEKLTKHDYLFKAA